MGDVWNDQWTLWDGEVEGNSIAIVEALFLFFNANKSAFDQ